MSLTDHLSSVVPNTEWNAIAILVLAFALVFLLGNCVLNLLVSLNFAPLLSSFATFFIFSMTLFLVFS